MTQAIGKWGEVTREMRLVSTLLGKEGQPALPTFLALRRLPDSDKWATWDQITIELHALTGEVFTDVSLRRWARRYGIPDGTALTADQYREQIAKAGIQI